MDDRLRLLTVHAHPDDESSKGAGTVHKYHHEGVHTVLVCCTGGEAGDILNPAMDKPEVRERLHDVRMEEQARATDLIGYDEVVMLGYRDSGMPDTPENEDPRAFANAELADAVGRLVEVIRTERPQVIVTYGDDQQGYPHPDHLRVHDISLPAFDAAGDPVAWARARVVAMHEKFQELGLESPFDERWFERPSQDHRITTRIDVGEHDEARRAALLAHATQIDPESPFWFGLPAEVAREAYPFEDYVLARSLVDSELPEDDLFAGIRVSDRT